MEAVISKPFIFNPLKHHSGHIKSFIGQCKFGEIEKAVLQEYLLKMGNCMLDLYFGELGITQILSDIENMLKEGVSFGPESYAKYIKGSSRKFQNIQISDHSTWTLLIGNEPERYIHIHPARGSEYTVRIRAIALKTALIMKIYYGNQLEDIDLVDLTNEIRLNYLDESPIKNITYTKGIKRALAHL
jgi:hypothetical protein